MVIFIINKWFIVPNIGWFLGVKESIIYTEAIPTFRDCLPYPFPRGSFNPRHRRSKLTRSQTPTYPQPWAIYIIPIKNCIHIYIYLHVNLNLKSELSPTTKVLSTMWLGNCIHSCLAFHIWLGKWIAIAPNSSLPTDHPSSFFALTRQGMWDQFGSM